MFKSPVHRAGTNSKRERMSDRITILILRYGYPLVGFSKISSAKNKISEIQTMQRVGTRLGCCHA